MKRATILLCTLTVLILMGQIVFVGERNTSNSNSVDNESQVLVNKEPDNQLENNMEWAQDSASGTLSPVEIAQSGESVSDYMYGRTDTGINGRTNLSIDEANGWYASKADVEVFDLQRLYAFNGTFDSTSDPWTSDLYDSDGSQTQTATYDSTNEWVVLNNTGEYNYHPVLGESWTHYYQSELLWKQTIQNTPYTENFTLSFDFNYANGVLDPSPYELDGDMELRIYIGAQPYYLSLMTGVDTINRWFSILDFDIYYPSAPASFDIAIGFYIEYDDCVIYANVDHDDSGQADGATAAKSLVLLLDDISLEGVNSPPFADMDIEFHAGGLSANVAGPTGGTGTASISNPSSWTTNPLQVEVSSNTSVAYSYRVTVTTHRVTNSSWEADPTKYGVSYSVLAGESISLEFYTYIGTTEYENHTVSISIPKDWENVTVRDPLLTDVTSSCTITSDQIGIPTSLLDAVGWWRINLDAPNYAQSVKTQIYDTGVWNDESLFRSGNESRVRIQLGTLTETPVIANPINISWILPNGTTWALEAISSGVAGLGTGIDWNLGALNTSAGLWTVECIWSNGTEIAFDYVSLSMYHATTLTPINAEINTDHGLTITNMLHYVDSDNGEYLMDESATMEGNWSASTISFAPNYVRNWWEADIDTSTLDAGTHTVNVTVSRPYFDDATCTFVVRSTYTTSFDVLNTTIDTDLFTQNVVILNYEYANGTGITSAGFDVSYTGTAGGLTWNPITENQPGEYELRISGSTSGTYEVTVTGYKLNHFNASDSLEINVNEYETKLTVINGTTGITSVSQDYRMVVRYTRNMGFGLDSATVVVESMLPVTGLNVGTITDLTDGYYSIILEPVDVAIYNIVLRANTTNHATSYASFALTVTEDPMTLVLAVETETIGVTESYMLNMTLVDESLVGVQGASISIIDAPSGLFFNSAQDYNNGNYSILIDPLQYGIFLVKVSASAPNYLDSIDFFTLIVDVVGTELILVNGSVDTTDCFEEYNLVVRYLNSSGAGLIGADIEITSVTPILGLGYGTFGHIIDGYYGILLDPTNATIFTIQISANLTNHQIQYAVFTLTVTENPMTLTLAVNVETIEVTESYILNMTLVDENLVEIIGASISIIDAPSGLLFTPAQDHNDGNYSILIEPIQYGTWTVIVSASAPNYLDSIDVFTLIVGAIGTELILVNGSVDTTNCFEEYNLVVRYLNSSGLGLIGADIQVTSVTPSSGLSYGTFQYIINGYYGILLDPINATIFTIQISANLTNHQIQYTVFTLTVSGAPTSIELASTSVTISITELYVVGLTYTDSYGIGIPGANITIIDPPPELTFLNHNDLLDGNYTFTLNPSFFGTYLITVSASAENYQTTIESFTLVVDEEKTSLIMLNGTADFVEFGEEYQFVLRYLNSTPGGIAGADVLILNVTPGIGLIYGLFQDDTDGYYNILFQPTQATVYTILMSANMTNHQVQYGTFTITVTEIATSISLNVTSAVISVSEELVVKVSYLDSSGIGISGATISIVNPPAGLDFPGYTDNLDGNYTFVVDPNLFGTYLVTVSAFLDNYQEGFVSFSIVVGEIGTELLRANDTASDIVRIGESYLLILRYVNSTGNPLTGATVAIADINPSTGLDYENTTDESDGYYSILLTPMQARTFTIVIRANLTNHVTQFTTFSLTVSEIPTVLTIDKSETTISIDQSYTVMLHLVYLVDDLGTDLNGATIILLEQPDEFNDPIFTPLTDGYYNITLSATQIGTYQIALRAVLTNYQNSTIGFTLTVRTIPTSFVRIVGPESNSISFVDDYTIGLLYVRTDIIPNQNISLARLGISVSPTTGLNVINYTVGDIYYIQLLADTTGRWRISLTANKTDYVSAFMQFEIEVLPVETTINEFTLLESFIFGRSYNLTFNYEMMNGSAVTDVLVVLSGSAAQWTSYEMLGDGSCVVTIVPVEIGDYEVTLTFSRTGYVARVSELSFTVTSIPIEIVDVSGLDGLEGQMTTISLRVVESDTGTPVTGLLIEYQIITDTGPGQIEEMNEVATSPGTYETTLVMPAADLNTAVRFYLEHDILELSLEYEDLELEPTVNELSLITRTFTRYLPIWIILGGAVVGLVGRRIYGRRKREQNIEAMIIKRRFDDAQSILGVIVLHRESGIPIYSNIVKGGIDEILISGFISAITQFRSEFDVDQEQFTIQPISDIIRAVHTENLICAFITLSSPGQSQEVKMIQFAEAVGFIFDNLFTEPPIQVVEDGTLIQFDALFDDLMDGQLLRKHRIIDSRGLPRSSSCIVKHVEDVHRMGAFELQELATRMTSCGLEEAHVYKMIWDAIESKSIDTVPKAEVLEEEPVTSEDSEYR
ncbi:MAG: carboxypeptidase-like regulatory domain-containing protein [Candidatus Thorarchaeota archaeon]